jgi:hypothetical protein
MNNRLARKTQGGIGAGEAVLAVVAGDLKAVQ